MVIEEGGMAGEEWRASIDGFEAARIEAARAEVGHTTLAPGVAPALIAIFLTVISAVPFA